jgi:hypothetical protein
VDTYDVTRELSTMEGRIPKIIDPATHAVLDYMTAGSFFALGFAMLNRHSRAATLAFINGAAVLGLSLLTDYPGGVWRKVSFRTHGMIDVAQAAMSAGMPAMMGFARDAEAQAFHAQAALEMGVVATTDWSASAA